MNEITQASALFPQRTATGSSGNNGELGQQDFLQLLVAQLEHQDPAKPMDNFQFLSQIAQFGMVDGISRLEGSFGQVADSFRQGQLTQAASLLGREVMASGGKVQFEGAPVTGNVAIPAGAENVNLEIRTRDGLLVRSEVLPAGSHGERSFSWDGTGSNGEMQPNGLYEFFVSGTVEGSEQQLPVSATNRVGSVVLDEHGGIALALSNGTEVSIDEIDGVR